MRYIIHSKTKKGDKYLQDLISDNEEHLAIINHYDPIMRLEGRVEKIGNALRLIKQDGATWDVLNFYMRGKGIAQHEIDSVMEGAEEFFKKMGVIKNGR